MNDFAPKQFGKYFLLEKLAVGGMAEIYKAKTYGAEGFEKLLAIKRILPHAAEDKDFISMLIDEAKLSVMLSHANIVQVFDLGKIETDYFISMEFIHGVNLRDILYRLREKEKKLPIELAAYCASEICKGLDYAHRKTDSNNQPLGIVHRDVSPQNILISYEGEVKIVDFGIAKAAMNISHTMAGILKGKIAYMSPEQALGKNIDARTDVFSLGIVLYEMLTGKKLFTGESQFEVLKKIRTSRIDVGKLPPSIPAPLKTILAHALAYEVEERYPSAGDMQVALTKYLYATYTDFSPRKMAVFVKDLFADELRKEKSKKDQEAMEAGTGSISLVTGKKQETLVHRETLTPKGKEDTHPITVRETTIPPKSKQAAIWGGLALLLVAGLGWGMWKWVFAPAPPPPLAAAAGTLHVRSDPPGADIYLNGAPTPYKTPAILEDLAINKKHYISFAMENYGRLEKTIELNSADPVFLDVTLSKNTGVLNVISEPPGAAILVNGIATGKVTPATLEDLNLKTEYRVTLSKPDYQDFEQPVTLVSSSPQKIMASLEPVAKESFGTVLVESEPAGAKIFLDTENTGKVTPATLERLEVGQSYVLRLEKEKHRPFEKKIEVTGVEPLSVKEKLAMIEPPLPPKPDVKEKPKEDKKPEVVVKPKPPEPIKQRGFANIQVTSSPSGADVFVNGEHRGATPAALKVAAGSVKVMVSKGADLLPCRWNLLLGSGLTENLNCTLGSLFGRINIQSLPPRADVYLNGQKMGGTPMIIKKVQRDKAHTLRVELPGYRPWVKAFDLKDSESKSFNVELEKS